MSKKKYTENFLFDFVPDVSEKKRLEDDLDRYKQNFRSLAESFPDSVIQYDQAVINSGEPVIYEEMLTYLDDGHTELLYKCNESGNECKSSGVAENQAGVYARIGLKRHPLGKRQYE